MYCSRDAIASEAVSRTVSYPDQVRPEEVGRAGLVSIPRLQLIRTLSPFSKKVRRSWACFMFLASFVHCSAAYRPKYGRRHDAEWCNQSSTSFSGHTAVGILEKRCGLLVSKVPCDAALGLLVRDQTNSISSLCSTQH